jgi:tetratricopeptide (TPR) repeat protein
MKNIKLVFLFFSIVICTGCYPEYIKLNNSGYKKTQVQDYDGAFKDFEKSIALNDTYWLSYANRASSYAIKGEFEKALNDYNKSISLKKENSLAYDGRGSIKQTQNDTIGAIADYREALKYGKRNYIVYTHLGRTLAEMDSCDEAVKYLTIAIQKKAFNDCNTKEELLKLKNKCEK